MPKPAQKSWLRNQNPGSKPAKTQQAFYLLLMNINVIDPGCVSGGLEHRTTRFRLLPGEETPPEGNALLQPRERNCLGCLSIKSLPKVSLEPAKSLLLLQGRVELMHSSDMGGSEPKPQGEGKERGKGEKKERGKGEKKKEERKEERGKRKEERGKRKEERGKRKEEEERGKRKEERGKRKEERGKGREGNHFRF
ncbi:hypothetical protein DUI87_28002 [Hirundo rustica rustica]|uniref:Uncharacterized protein n=1 Tax=Hirundo rustica rustica TaxID=333673 RepID=A0A3M0J4N1_HIRRU|nr:hypothetical protein DUI87_28002 [Hirundo rustica rustica]